ncbi:hypothetical protein FIBSPDRAFT_1054968 [Athelia psychrophila]|uniref:Uncharacterized protein n=1 Tax=Athelia psychrophila TaxID=1759441 RepID=A0A167UIL0_9AGAM|nr:hypothetical protein FIBSPDRAFT_1054968 [Fibularhizoctonia sp. CBS 109695]
MPIKATIDSAFSLKKSAIDMRRDYFSQAIEIITCCHEIDIEGRPDLFPKLREVYRAVQDALDAAPTKGSRRTGKVDAAFESAWDLLKEPDLNLRVEEMQQRQNSARQNDAKTQARLDPIEKQYEIKKAYPPGKDVKLQIFLGADHLTGSQDPVITEPFGSNHTLNIVLWILIQSRKCRMDQNPYFYSGKALGLESLNRQFKTGPLLFDEGLKMSKAGPFLHALVDLDCRLVLQSEDLTFYRNFGNIWSTPGSAGCKIVKHLDGTLEATDRIEEEISTLKLGLVSGWVDPPGFNVWDEYVRHSLSNTGEAVFIYKKISEEEWEAGALIDSSLSCKKSARGIADIECDYISQTIEIMACCHEIDIEDRPGLVPKLREVCSAAQDALDAAKGKGSENRSSADADAAFERIWGLLKEPDLNLHVEEIQQRQDSARQMSVRTQARLVPMKRHEIRQASPTSKDVNLEIFLGADDLTGSQEWIYTEDPFGSNQTPNTVLWCLIQHGICRMDQNPYFYSREVLDLAILDPLYKTAPLSSKERLRRSGDMLSLHLLVDKKCRLVLQSEDLTFYRNFGNIWSTPGSAECKIVKHLDGTLEATCLIDETISALRLRLVPRPAYPPGFNVWDEYLGSSSTDIGEVVFIYKKVSEEEWEAEE